MNGSLWIAIQGSILSGWIVIEVIMIRMISWAHYLYLAIGLVLILSGLALARKNREY